MLLKCTLLFDQMEHKYFFAMCLITVFVFFLHYTNDFEERFKQGPSTIATEKALQVRENQISNVRDVYGKQVTQTPHLDK